MASVFKIPGAKGDVDGELELKPPVAGGAAGSDGKETDSGQSHESANAGSTLDGALPRFHVPGLNEPSNVGDSVGASANDPAGSRARTVDPARSLAGQRAGRGGASHSGGYQPSSVDKGSLGSVDGPAASGGVAGGGRPPFSPFSSHARSAFSAPAGSRPIDDARAGSRVDGSSPSTLVASGSSPFKKPRTTGASSAPSPSTSADDGRHVSSADGDAGSGGAASSDGRAGAGARSLFTAPVGDDAHVSSGVSLESDDGEAQSGDSRVADGDGSETHADDDAGRLRGEGDRGGDARGVSSEPVSLPVKPRRSHAGSLGRAGGPRAASRVGDAHADSGESRGGGPSAVAGAGGSASDGESGSDGWSPDSFLDVGVGFDPGWSDTVGAGEDAPAFTGGSFLDLGDEDDDTLVDDVDDGRGDAPAVGRYAPSRDGESAGFVGDDGAVVHGDLEQPQTWRATTSHDPGDDGRQSIAWNKDGKAAAVKPAEERLTVLKRYHRAGKEEMGARREIAEQVAAQGGLPDEGGALVDPKTGKPVAGSSAAHGGSGDSEIDERALRFGVKVGTGKAKLEKQLRNKHDVDVAIARRVQVLEWKKGFHVTFGAKEVRGLDYLTRWSYATTAQIARVIGWRDKKERRLVRLLEKWEEMGWVRQDVVFSGPRLWYPRRDGAELSEHAWLGGVSPARVNPMSQSHSLGLSSIASWLLCGWDDAPDILQLGEAEWKQLQADVKTGEALIISEKEYRAPWTKIRQTHKGLLPAEYRHAFIGDIGHGGEGRYQQWARDYKLGLAKLEDAPDWVACDPSLQGDDMWIWTLWSNSVWNPKMAIDAARLDGVAVDGLSREQQLQVIRDYRMDGYVPVEDRLDIATNKPVVNRELGDSFALLDHLPDLVIARKRDPQTGASRSVAVELELTAKAPGDYARSMAGFGSTLGQTLYDQVIWVVPSNAVARAIELGAGSVGLERDVDYRIVPFASAEKRNSFWSGADIVPAVFDKYHRVQPLIDPAEFLLS